METERVRTVAKQFDQTTLEIQEQVTVLGTRLHSINWESPSRDAFISDYDRLEKKIIECASQGTTLAVSVQREADEWEQAALSLAGGTLTTAQIHARSIIDARRSIKNEWKEMSIDERKRWLEEWYKKLCKSLGMKTVDFRVRDLKDPKGQDAHGVFRPAIIFGLLSSMTVDIDNVKGDDPFSVMETVAHETRHQYQHYLVEHPDKRPTDISEDQIRTWKENFHNYKRPEDNFEAYRKQPVEADARQAEKSAVNEYIDDKAESI